MHRALSSGFGPRWFSSQAFRAALDMRTLSAVDAAIWTVRTGTGSGGTPPAGAVVAQLMFGTWVQILAPGAGGRQDALIWQPVLAPVFKHSSAHTRSQVFALAQRVNWARNRVNHCEPIVFGFPFPGRFTATGQRRRATPGQILDDARELTSAIDGSVAAWVDSWAELDQLLSDRRVADALAFKARDRGISLEGRR